MNTRTLRERLSGGGAVLFDLRGRALFRLTGADRVRYLNGQVSNDIRRAGPGEALPACVMTAKGKMNGFIWVAAGEEALTIDADAALREALAARLERYIISDDAALSDFTDEARLFHQLGGESPLPLPEGGRAVRSRRFGLPGWDLLVPAGAAFEPADAALVDDVTAETFRIEQGIPAWGAELDENTIPVEAGLDETAIDYHKGCYIGQEVISRIRSVGRVNRTLTGFVAAEPLSAGEPLLSGGREVGRITSAAWSFALDSAAALGYLKRGTDTAAALLTASGKAVAARGLPLVP